MLQWFISISPALLHPVFSLHHWQSLHPESLGQHKSNTDNISSPWKDAGTFGLLPLAYKQPCPSAVLQASRASQFLQCNHQPVADAKTLLCVAALLSAAVLHPKQSAPCSHLPASGESYACAGSVRIRVYWPPPRWNFIFFWSHILNFSEFLNSLVKTDLIKTPT